jgi:hypothetical protein
MDFDALEGARMGTRSCTVLGKTYTGLHDVSMALVKERQEVLFQLTGLDERFRAARDANDTGAIEGLMAELTAASARVDKLTAAILEAGFGKPTAKAILAHEHCSQSLVAALVEYICSGYNDGRVRDLYAEAGGESAPTPPEAVA